MATTTSEQKHYGMQIQQRPRVCLGPHPYFHFKISYTKVNAGSLNEVQNKYPHSFCRRFTLVVFQHHSLLFHPCLPCLLFFCRSDSLSLTSCVFRHQAPHYERAHASAPPGGAAGRARLHCGDAHPKRRSNRSVLWRSVHARDPREGNMLEVTCTHKVQ